MLNARRSEPQMSDPFFPDFDNPNHLARRLQDGKKPRTRYTRAACDEVLQYFSEGQSLAEVAANLGISYTTFSTWRKKHPDFDAAIQDGLKLAEAWWRSQGRRAMASKISSFPPAVYIFTMKSRFGDTDQPQPEPPSEEQLKSMGIHINLHPAVAQEAAQKASEPKADTPQDAD